jgi:hypothetical protein
MGLILFLIGVVAVCVLAARYGVDSRHTEPTRRHRPNLF